MKNVVLVVNSKGGVGKTTFAQNFLLPALGKAVFIDTDVYNRGIAFIENSEYLVKGIKLKTVDIKIENVSSDLVKITDEFVNILSNYENENIIIDTGATTIADVLLRAIMRFGVVNMIFIPTREQAFNLDANLKFIQQYTDKYMIVDIITYGNGQIYIPDINISLLGFVREKGITLPEIVKFLDSPDLRERALANGYIMFYQKQIDAIIENIRKVLQ
ncbi:MAG: hypothetical protein QW575_08805 [Thermoproteota archaeon]